ncbi:Triosephosphate isomerase [Mycoplasmopsis meleagridis]|uniref:Triosephosphate isomerase n=1 Tax=Mycoplasmopsis meleagridis ATCC 25294 TaxID=1264554 RepID=A0A0F5H110_9BACT|nr:triose-phosphate isomerase [Mycoplasmopsis meleagridis]KKB26989.1 Triosephosphate isomerase [Mycoplasmopsis meleagridis ATCC 25294]OAD18336.1 Triosephosphate isomerase [Mycoplasmopsis meleagridis]VEU77466.1 Triosephosphate isomerase [Mycoplasmopsis meleagridis]
MKKLFFMANWKCNINTAKTIEFMKEFDKLYKELVKNTDKELIFNNNEIVIAPSLVSLGVFKSPLIPKIPNLELGAQNVSAYGYGPYTGEVCAEMLHALDVKYVIVGHCERRKHCKEDDELVYKKVKNVINANMIPIICVGESEEENKTEKTKQIIEKQILNAIKDLDYEKLIISYEPTWAVGSHAAIPDQANEICKFIKKITSNKCKVLYGGSVNIKNVDKLASQEYIDGFLIGTASLNPKEFLEITTCEID